VVSVARALAGVGVIALAAACARAPTASAPRDHPLIVSLNPCSDAVLAEVADRDQIAAISSYSQDPRATSMDLRLARSFQATGGTAEEVVGFHPDVVIAASFLPASTRTALARLGLRVETLGIADDVPASLAQVRQIAAWAGHPERGEAMARRIETALAAAAPQPGAAPIPAVLWEQGGMVPGADTLVSDLMRRTGFANFAAAQGMRQADRLPLEVMLAHPPRVILMTGDARSDGDRALRHPALAGLKSTVRARFDPVLTYCGGPTIARAVSRLADVRRTLSPLPLAGGAGVGQRHSELLRNGSPPLADVPSIRLRLPAGGRGVR
jgi:iron complex transport system substrate-binding protein